MMLSIGIMSLLETYFINKVQEHSFTAVSSSVFDNSFFRIGMYPKIWLQATGGLQEH